MQKRTAPLRGLSTGIAKAPCRAAAYSLYATYSQTRKSNAHRRGLAAKAARRRGGCRRQPKAEVVSRAGTPREAHARKFVANVIAAYCQAASENDFPAAFRLARLCRIAGAGRPPIASKTAGLRTVRGARPDPGGGGCLRRARGHDRPQRARSARPGLSACRTARSHKDLQPEDDGSPTGIRRPRPGPACRRARRH